MIYGDHLIRESKSCYVNEEVDEDSVRKRDVIIRVK